MVSENGGKKENDLTAVAFAKATAENVAGSEISNGASREVIKSQKQPAKIQYVLIHKPSSKPQPAIRPLFHRQPPVTFVKSVRYLRSAWHLTGLPTGTFPLRLVIMASRRCHYDAAFKRNVITDAEALGNCAAGRKHGVPENNVRRWRKEKEALFACAATRKAFRGPRKAIPDAMVAASFKKCCISNSLDGTDDSEVWECTSNKESSDASDDDSS
ncbi:hypothetical protein HPB49_002742 [Dermacentor silvarum]|uniref:Uncharacterized protein n=1 Tax=Dermacentor silvarum TaxID=543639 RepID=A0ACB8CD14_DERSI|nr:hypothetical protein HPB49_002742 [Dermacentor silvarum]